MRAASIPARPRLGPFRSKRLLALAGDERLVEAMRRGNEAAFEVAFERYGPGILGFCRHMLGSVEEAEDAVQHSFAAAFGSLQRDDERELALKPWLYTIARNRCVSLLRSRQEPVSLDTDVATAGLTEHVERRAELRELLGDLAELPDEQRAALLLAELGDLSHTQVAAVLGCEPSKVKALVFRARTGLIQRREARDTPCDEIREQLATLHGGSLRRNRLRHHLRACPGCRAYREQVKHQRRLLAAALPVVPSLGLKASVLGAIGLGGGSTGGGLVGLGGLGAAVSTSSLGVSGAAKLAAVGVLAGGSLVAGGALVDDAAKQPGAAGQVAPAPGKERSVPAAPKEALVRPVADHGRPERGLGARAAPPGSKQLTEAPAAGRTGHDRGRKVGHVKNGKGAPPATQTGTAPPGYGFGRQKRAAKPTPALRGRGPVGAPPASTPVKRGPPQPKPKQQAQRGTKATATGRVATTGPPEAHAPQQRKVKPTKASQTAAKAR